MKKLLFLVAIATLICCKPKNVETSFFPGLAKVEVAAARNSDKNFLFIPNEKSLTLVNISMAQVTDDSLKRSFGRNLSHVGLYNMFALNNNGIINLCTTSSSVCNLQSKMIGDSIALLDRSLTNLDIKGSYKIETFSVRDNDSIFVKGYTVSEDGNAEEIILRCLAHRLIVEKNKAILIIRVPKNVNLNNLIGAPVINRWNRAVGVFAGYVLQDLKKEKYNYTKATLFYN